MSLFNSVTVFVTDIVMLLKSCVDSLLCTKVNIGLFIAKYSLLISIKDAIGDTSSAIATKLMLSFVQCLVNI